MRNNHFFFCFLISLFFIPAAATAQTANFEETWKEFLTNNQISNVSGIVRPNKTYEQQKYAKYLLMITTSNFCQSEMNKAERMLEEMLAMDPQVLKSIPRYIERLDDLEKKVKAYHTMDGVWTKYLKTKKVSLDELSTIHAAKTSCEKETLAKYSYMTAYAEFCEGNVSKAKDIFENRTLRLTEKTSLRVNDVEGLREEVANMKSLFKNMSKLDAAWGEYVSTGVSPGFDIELPFFHCNPVPNMKALLLQGALDICNSAPLMLEEINKLEKESGIGPDRELARKIKDVKRAIGANNEDLATLNKAWKAFLPENQVPNVEYSYEYCEKEPTIRAYIMTGFTSVCDMAAEMLSQIEELQSSDPADLDRATKKKIKELEELTEVYRENGERIEMIWRNFVTQGDQFSNELETTEQYCDNVHQVKDWTISGLTGTCEESLQYLGEIEAFQANFDFSFTDEVECRIQWLRIKIWECQHEALQEMAKIEASASSTYEERLAGLMEEYGLGERPEDCVDR